jgi:ribonuclease HII
MNSESLVREEELRRAGTVLIAGIDEAGRGPLAGPVVAAAVIFPEGFYLPGVDDSKKVPPERREKLYEQILAAAAVGIGVVDNDEIDRINILNATFLAMDKAVGALPLMPDHLLIDGNMYRPGGATRHISWTTVVGGDAVCFSIAGASIVAKVARDRLMREFDREYPGFGFARHKGYGTAEHRAAIGRIGLCPIHRRSFTLRFRPDIHPGGRPEGVKGGGEEPAAGGGRR